MSKYEKPATSLTDEQLRVQLYGMNLSAESEKQVELGKLIQLYTKGNCSDPGDLFTQIACLKVTSIDEWISKYTPELYPRYRELFDELRARNIGSGNYRGLL